MRFFATIRLKQLQYTFLVIYFHLNRSDFKKFRIILKNLKMGNFWNNSIIHLFEQLPTFSCRNLLLMILIFKMAWSVLTKCGDKSSLKGGRGAVWGPSPKNFFFSSPNWLIFGTWGFSGTRNRSAQVPSSEKNFLTPYRGTPC